MDKIIVAIAGPLFSFGLALVFAVLVWGIGRPVSESDTTTTIGYVVTNSPAAMAGLKAGDRILNVDGHPVSKFGGIGDTIMWRIVRSEGDTVPVTVLRDGKEITFEPKPVREKTEVWERRSLRQIQIYPKQTPLIAGVDPLGPAAEAGIKPNDIIVAVNGTNIFNPEALTAVLRAGVGRPIVLTIKRGQDLMEKSVTPVMPDVLINNTNVPAFLRYHRIGIEWEAGGIMAVDYPNPIDQIKGSITAMTSTLGAVLSKKSDIGFQHMSGPVGIGRIYYRLFESEQGWRLAIWFSVILNVNLALLNMLPIPVLDGGHITLAIIEGIRRKPVNVKIIGFIQTGCALLIIGYMLFVTFFDAQDLPWKRQPKLPEIRFTAPTTPPAPAQP
jgi:regulator of sigma E protease